MTIKSDLWGRPSERIKISENILPHQSSVIGWIMIIVEPTDAPIRKILMERRIVRANSKRSAFLIVIKMDMFVATIPVHRTMRWEYFLVDLPNRNAIPKLQNHHRRTNKWKVSSDLICCLCYYDHRIFSDGEIKIMQDVGGNKPLPFCVQCFDSTLESKTSVSTTKWSSNQRDKAPQMHTYKNRMHYKDVRKVYYKCSK